jgi:predicted AAA+ superfamily ATPase
MKIPRLHHIETLMARLQDYPIVAIFGPRQVGKSTLARDIAEVYGQSHYFDLERPRDLARLSDPEGALEPLHGLVILDEAQQQPELFPLLRVLADRPESPARFLVLGSASADLRRQAGESLAGRIHYYDLSGLNTSEVGLEALHTLWLRGGFPDAYTARDEPASVLWREDFIRGYLERDLSMMGFTAPPTSMRRFWTMLAHSHGQTLNLKRLADALGETPHKVRRYLDSLTSTFMLRQLQPWFANTAKRQVKAPQLYITDTGLLHTLLGIETHADLLSHPIAGASWESFAMGEIVHRFGFSLRSCFFWGAHSGAELDLFYMAGAQRLGFEFKLSTTPRTTKSMHIAIETLELDRLYIVTPGTESWPMGGKLRTLGLGGEVAIC